MEVEIIRSNRYDNVATSVKQLALGDIVNLDGKSITVTSDVAKGHKLALEDIKEGEEIIKFGIAIGTASKDIRTGELVHVFNMKEIPHTYPPFNKEKAEEKLKHYYSKSDFSTVPSIRGYKREDGRWGIRNSMWAILTKPEYQMIEGIYNFEEADEDRIRAIRRNPNCGALLIIAEGDIKNSFSSIYKDDERVAVLSPSEDIETEKERLSGILSEEDKSYTKMSSLIIGLKSSKPENRAQHIAHQFIARCSEEIIAYGGSVLLSETEKYLNSEVELLSRCVTEEIYNKTRKFFEDNEDRRRKEISKPLFFSGLSNVREVSAGNILKMGDNAIAGVLRENELPDTPGVFLLDSDTDDSAFETMVLSGATVALYANDDEKKIYSPIPVIGIASDPENVNTDFNASDMIEVDINILIDEFFHYLVSIANGRSLSDNEKIL